MYITIAVLRETQPGERRMAMVPMVAALLIKDFGVKIQIQAREKESVEPPDSAFENIESIEDRIALVRHADVILAVHAPALEVIDAMKEGAILISFIDRAKNPTLLQHLMLRKITCFAMERIPDTPRAKPMNALMSQAVVEGYRSVILGAMYLSRCLPEITTAAEVIGPARVLVLGLGTSGMEAIATAKRMGAIVDGYDGDPGLRMKAIALGITVIDHGILSSDAAGHPDEVSPEEWTRVDDLLTWHVHQADLIIASARIPDHAFPHPMSRVQMEGMKNGSVIVDLVPEITANCAAEMPGEVMRMGGVTVLAPLRLASQMAMDASQLYAMNMYHLLAVMMKDHGIAIDWRDEILSESVISHDGEERNGGW